MQRNSLHVSALTVFLFLVLSCTRMKEDTSSIGNPLIGEWKLDSLAIGKDTSLASLISLIAMYEDPAGINFTFTTDSIFTYSKNDIDTVAYRFNKATNCIIIKDKACYYIRLNDSVSSIRITNADKFFIKRKGRQ